ncbi:DNA-3-methyladenine glycosylase [Fontibacillus phaseoli]|uniref:Putative 3-methyladenine DNA glycosylase n=1 Tax=Fontibacillus phaseoli TaxID=1416533 RepID=A0A369AZ51_9BACL|nr:DNA-3-methyladenine glycosylase [Fontibacillus phaseoli]RCX14431.1 DNA-3-methyladenine glycosylase [Fontibacillus phaseoli]
MKSMPSNFSAGGLLPLSFYAVSALKAAPRLLGQTLVRETEEGEIRCRIVETESYGGVEDKGSHAYGGRRTARTEIMFGEGGAAYIYLIYGMYHCLNVVTGPQDDPQAVLIRAVEPLTPGDEDLMRAYRGSLARRPMDLSGGPGKLCRALNIDKSLNGVLLHSGDSPLRLEAAGTPAEPPARDDGSDIILAAPRINIAYAAEYAEVPWRFYYQDNPYVSVVDKNRAFLIN